MNEKKKICVISMENHTGHLLYIVAHANHLAYCRKNGYEYFESTDFSRYPNRDHAHWCKFPVIDDAMQKHPEMDYYLWIDIDAYFTSMDIRLETLIPMNSAEILMNKDHPGNWHNSMFDYGFNSGTVIIKNTANARDFIKELASDRMYELGCRMHKGGIIHYRDQDMLTFLAQIGSYRGILSDKGAERLQKFIRPPKNGVDFARWGKGDYILHLAGNSFARKQEILKELGYDLSTGEVGINA